MFTRFEKKQAIRKLLPTLASGRELKRKYLKDKTLYRKVYDRTGKLLDSFGFEDEIILNACILTAIIEINNENK